ncbi:37S ribosomal protein S24, mitochondrial, partial [Coemansia sp. RSA 1933]
MHSIITTQLRSAKSRNIATTTAVRLIHASAVQQVGRKRRGGVPSSERKLHAALYEQEDQENDIDELQEWDNDDHHVYGHMLMDGIRDVRRYARQMKFEHPTLAEYKKPFRAPSKSHILEFESSATMGEKIQANDRKVVMRVKVSRLGLSASELHKFVLLAESRYNPQKDELKMSESRE